MTQDEIIEMARQADKGFDGGPDADGTMEDSIVGIDAVIRFAKLVAAKEREAITDEYWSCIQSDLEHGVKCLSEKAALNFRKSMPELSKFGTWLDARGEA